MGLLSYLRAGTMNGRTARHLDERQEGGHHVTGNGYAPETSRGTDYVGSLPDDREILDALSVIPKPGLHQ
jgi:hypothetical protein